MRPPVLHFLSFTSSDAGFPGCRCCTHPYTQALRPRKRLHGVLLAHMEQDNRTGPHLPQNLLGHLRSRRVFPVQAVDVPFDAQITRLFHRLDEMGWIFPIRGAVQAGFNAGQRFNARLAGARVGHNFLSCHLIDMRMLLRVVLHFVSLTGNRLHRVGKLPHKVAHTEKRYLDVILLQYAENGFHILVSPSGVEGQRHFFLLGIHSVDRQFFDTCGRGRCLFKQRQRQADRHAHRQYARANGHQLFFREYQHFHKQSLRTASRLCAPPLSI